ADTSGQLLVIAVKQDGMTSVIYGELTASTRHGTSLRLIEPVCSTLPRTRKHIRPLILGSPLPTGLRPPDPGLKASYPGLRPGPRSRGLRPLCYHPAR